MPFTSATPISAVAATPDLLVAGAAVFPGGLFAGEEDAAGAGLFGATGVLFGVEEAGLDAGDVVGLDGTGDAVLTAKAALFAVYVCVCVGIYTHIYSDI